MHGRPFLSGVTHEYWRAGSGTDYESRKDAVNGRITSSGKLKKLIILPEQRRVPGKFPGCRL